MGNQLRNSDPELFRIVTLRTVRAEMWFEPTGKNARLIGGIIARYQELFGIEIYAYKILSNHMHLLIRAPRGNADEFLENVDREIARRINRKYGRQGPLWARRYSEQQILDTEADLLHAFLYINLNATRHGLLKDASQWRGLSSFHHVLSEEDRTFSFTHYSDLDENGKPKQTFHKLKISVLPQFQALSKKARRKKLLKLLYQQMELFWETRNGKPYLGQAAIDLLVPGTVPKTVSRSPRGGCYSKFPELIREWKKRERLRRALYHEASFRYRLGDTEVEFPAYTFKPPLHRASRLKPFCPLSSDSLKLCA